MTRITLIVHNGRIDFAFSNQPDTVITVLDFDAPGESEAAGIDVPINATRVPIDLVSRITQGSECVTDCFNADHDPDMVERTHRLAQDAALRAADRLAAELAEG